MRKAISLFLMFSVLLLSGNMFAQERRGADVEIYKTKQKTENKMEGTPWESTGLKGIFPYLRGELIAVKEDSILFLDRYSRADVTVDFNDISYIKVRKKSQAGTGILLGGLLGAGIGAISYKEPESSGEAFVYAIFGINRVTSILVPAIVLGLVGLVFGAVAGTDKMITFEGKSESEIQKMLKKLRKKARVRNSQ